MHGECRGFGADLLHICRGQFDVECAQVFVEVLDVAGARDGDNERSPSQQPGQCDLCGGGVLGFGELCEEVNERPVRFQVFRSEAREVGAQIGFGVEPCAGADLAGQVALPEWTPRDEADTQFFTSVEDAVVFGIACPNRVFALDWRRSTGHAGITRTTHGFLDVGTAPLADRIGGGW